MNKIVSILLLLGLGQRQLIAQQCPAGSTMHVSSYSALAADTGKLLVMDCATACTVTLPSIPQSPQWTVWVETIGPGHVTIFPNGLTLNAAAASMTLPTAVGSTVIVSTDASNYYASAVLNPSTLIAQWVSPTGSDTNDGLSLTTAKQYVDTAMCSLPTGNCSTQLMGNGTIFIVSGSAANATSTCGIWIMSGGDPNYASPPACWMKDPGVSIHFVGITDTYGGPNSHRTRAGVWGGSNADNNHPALWIAGNGGIPLQFDDISFGAHSGSNGRGIVIGECSNNDRTGTCNTVSLTFNNVSAFVGNNTPNGGPCLDVAGWNYWIWFNNFGCSGNAAANVNGSTSNSAASMLFDGTLGHGNGLIYISDSNLDNGGIKMIPGNTGGGLVVKNTIEEGCCGVCPPVVWYTSWSAGTYGTFSDLRYADCPSGTNMVQNDATNTLYGAPIVINSGPVQGPALVLGSGSSSATMSPLRAQQFGTQGNYLTGETDVARRIAGFVPVGFTNLAYSNPASWATSNGTVSIATGVSDPFFGTGAATLTSSAGGTVNLSAHNPQSGSAGSWFIFGIWVKGGGWAPGALNYLQMGCPGYGGFASSEFYSNGGMQNDGNWQYVWGAVKTSGTSGNACLSATVQAGNPVTLYGPTAYYIPSGAVSDNEAADFASMMAPVDSACARGSNCNVAGHPMQLAPDSYSFLGSQPNGTVTYCSNCTIANPCASGGTGAIAKKLNGVWVCN